MSAINKSTPMLEQYWRLKAEVPQALLLFRLGDFYELFEEDARIASSLLDLQLTSRDGRVAMCGIPYHALNQYAPRLLKAGHVVAIAEQMEDPATTRGLVDRQIVRVLTAGTVIPDDDIGNPRLGMLYHVRKAWVAVVIELSSGTIHVAEALDRDWERLRELWEVWHPDEYLANVDPPQDGQWGRRIDATPFLKRWDPIQLERHLNETWGISGLRRFGLDGHAAAQEALAALWSYMRGLQRQAPIHLTDIWVHRLSGEMMLSARALKQLDVLEGSHSLWERLNECRTPMGARRLREWLAHPLYDEAAIHGRQSAVQAFIDTPQERYQVRQALAEVGDFSRRLARLVMGSGRPRDIQGIHEALSQVPILWELVHDRGIWMMPDNPGLDALHQWAKELDVLNDPVPARFDESPLIRCGIDPTIDRYREILTDHRQALVALESQERERSGMKSLRVGYHRTFGYYLEVTKSQAKTPPADWQRRQTTTHTERYVSDSLRELENQIQEAQARLITEEKAWANKLQSFVVEHGKPLSALATWLADVDVLQALAEAAVKWHYTCPRGIDETSPVQIQGMRHPVLEGVLDDYVTSDIELADGHAALVVTGPNMGGKSTFMRALAQNVIMAQIGGFVAASQWSLPLFDAILTRIGAHDDLVRGQSTFMVEMQDVAEILHDASERSLVLLDELGRGTSTYDGLAIAQAVVERLAMPNCPLTIFATHYHELTALAEANPRIQNWTAEVLQTSDGPVFTHRVIPGRASRSYGIEVARQAGLPMAVVRRAQNYLDELSVHAQKPHVESDQQLTFYSPDPVFDELKASLLNVQPDDLSPREAWLWMAQWHARLSQERS